MSDSNQQNRMPLQDIRLIVFDWDGTLMDSEGQIVTCLRAAMHELGLEPLADDVLSNVIVIGLREAKDTLITVQHAGVHDDIVGQYRNHWFASERS